MAFDGVWGGVLLILWPFFFPGLIVFVDAPVDLFPMDNDINGSVDSQTDLFAFDVDDSHPDVAANADFLSYPASKNEHGLPSWSASLVKRRR